MPKFVPVMVTAVPTPPEDGDRLEMFGGGITANDTPLLLIPLAVTVTSPVVAPVGTCAVIVVSAQLLMAVAVAPLKLTEPGLVPKFEPVIVTAAPTPPEVGDRLEMFGGGITVNVIPLLVIPLAVTATGPVVAPVGTCAVIEVLLQVLIVVAAAPSKLTEPCVVPKLVPAIVTAAPTPPEDGDRLLMLGGGITVNVIPLLVIPLAVTVTGPVVAPEGTCAVIEVLLQELIAVAAAPLKLTEPCVVPKFVPLIVTALPTPPDAGSRPVMFGGGITVNVIPLLAIPLAVTVMGPVVAPAGAWAVIDVLVQVLIVVAAAPLKLTEPCAVPKFVPAIVTAVPTPPEAGDRLVMLGGRITVNVTPLLVIPLAVTVTGPVVAPEGTCAVIEVLVQVLIVVAATPLKLTAPFVVPKLVPVIVTAVPAGPKAGDSLEMAGGGITVNVTPLLATPLTVTVTGPVVAPVGTCTAMELGVQLVIVVAAVPLNFTVPPVPKYDPLIVTAVPTPPEFGERLVTCGGATTMAHKGIANSRAADRATALRPSLGPGRKNLQKQDPNRLRGSSFEL